MDRKESYQPGTGSVVGGSITFLVDNDGSRRAASRARASRRFLRNSICARFEAVRYCEDRPPRLPVRPWCGGCSADGHSNN